MGSAVNTTNLQNAPVRYWDRQQSRMCDELIYGDGAIRNVYQTGFGRWLGHALLSRHWISKIYGWFQASRLSRGKIAPFINRFQINMNEYESGPFKSFNEFFIRQFRPGAREFVQDPTQMPAFAEGRYLAYRSISEDLIFPVKGEYLTAQALLDDTKMARPFIGGPLVISRLCPTDYHRFHYPARGRTLKSYRVPGRLHSVNPIALEQRGDIFCTNERQVSILQTEEFGLLAYIEVGALCVGKIVQSFDSRAEFNRGDEKGYFLFGASTVIVMGEVGRWLPDEELLNRTDNQTECFLRLGESFAKKLD